MFRSIRWRIAVSYILLILVVMFGLVVYLSDLVRKDHLANLRSQLTAEAQLMADALASAPAWDEPDGDLDPVAHRYAEQLSARVTLIGVDGTVLGESHEDRRQMDNHLYRPEVQQALATGQGSSIRFSRTVGYEMMYVAVPVTAGERVMGIARVALPLRQIEANVARLRGTILVAMLFTALGATLLALHIAERTARPVRRLTDVVQRMAAGDLSARLLPTTRDEVGTLTRSLNQMADRLRKTVNTLIEERGRLAAVLDNMADGVVITDSEGCVRLINPAALRLLGIEAETSLDRSLAQVIRDHNIIGLWQQCFEQGEEQVAPVEMDRRGTFLQVIVTPLRDAETGACLVILQDLTRVRQLETVRRDFISNISHELRTPLASLKALVDTLRDGALEDPPAAQRFLDRMEVEVDALTQMVQELLELARIESGQVPLQLALVAVADIVLPPVERLRPQAERAGLRLTIDLSPDLPPILADAQRMQQVLTNLVHNAIKFTPADGQIRVSSFRLRVSSDGEVQPETLNLKPEMLPPGEWVLIAVQDTGVGIPADDIPRIFERFYKADRARSGGGTGLGLAIAKHIVQAHGGRIWAESPSITLRASVEGKGSTFYVALPVP
ncbi:MAG: HAMP domain-containing protein [Anaerolineae bacterium]|nr:HAMP domain-containing protein [Anaerolineae bacterium]